MVEMVADLTLATENQNNFQEYLSNNPSLGIDLTVKCVQVFKEFYETKAKHRKLTWIYSLGTCNVNGKFDSKTIELILGTYWFTDRMRQIRIPLPPVDEREKVVEDVGKDRRYASSRMFSCFYCSRKFYTCQALGNTRILTSVKEPFFARICFPPPLPLLSTLTLTITIIIICSNSI
ncbi:hypothetical protein MTR67_007758 [Solanum verrucosum]|uniref:Cullin-like alpha+beta domain-containing protein n=1 Tax=Solanum verrucosum TaxID=315347 RepID=A0AAF0Q0U2_SOLVR|nr:hypothetical protein MTR67_007758 [Solanum verrucosum]